MNQRSSATALDRRGLSHSRTRISGTPRSIFGISGRGRRICAQMDLLLQPVEKPAGQADGEPETPAAPLHLPMQEMKTGQLTLF